MVVLLSPRTTTLPWKMGEQHKTPNDLRTPTRQAPTKVDHLGGPTYTAWHHPLLRSSSTNRMAYSRTYRQ